MGIPSQVVREAILAAIGTRAVTVYRDRQSTIKPVGSEANAIVIPQLPFKRVTVFAMLASSLGAASAA